MVERTTPEQPKPRLVINQLTLAELRSDINLYNSLLNLYCDIFNAPPWNDSWTPQEVAQIIEKQLKPQDSITVALRGENPIGFMWGYTGPSSEVVAESVETYLSRDYDQSTRNLIIAEVGEGLKIYNCPPLLFNHCEVGVHPQEQGRVGGYLIQSTVITQLGLGLTEWMYGITSIQSPLYRIVQSRGARLLCSLDKYLKQGENRVVMAMDMRNLLPGAKKRL